ncbi:MAG: S1 RNA-binding domain-containing protein [Anaerolineae bacterium]
MPEEIIQPEQLSSIEDLAPKMKLEGTVTNTEIYGAFVDIGLEREGMIHISRLARRRVNKVTDKVKPGDKVTVWVVDVEPESGRVALTLVEPPDVDWDDLKAGMVCTGKVIRLERYGAFVDIGAERPGLLHVREMSEGYVRHPSDVVKVGDEVEVRILKVDRRKRQIDLTMNMEENIAEIQEEEEPFLSPMEIAFRDAQRAMQREDQERGGKRSKKQRDKLEEIFRRTLERGQ